MKELFDMYDQARRKGSPTVFKIRDFKSTKLPIFTTRRKLTYLRRLREYEKAKGFISIRDDTVTPTSKGLLKARETRKDWD